MPIFEISQPETGPYPVTVKAGTTVFAQDGKTKQGTIASDTTVFTVVGETEDGKLVYLHGRSAGPRTRLGLVARTSIRRG